MGEVSYQELALHYTASPVSTAAILHLNMSVPNRAVQKHIPSLGWIDEVIEHDRATEGGYLFRPESPGLGIELNEEAAGRPSLFRP